MWVSRILNMHTPTCEFPGEFPGPTRQAGVSAKSFVSWSSWVDGFFCMLGLSEKKCRQPEMRLQVKTSRLVFQEGVSFPGFLGLIVPLFLLVSARGGGCSGRR